VLKHASRSETRIALLEGVCRVVCVPSIAVWCDGVQVHDAWDAGYILEELDAETLGHVPGDMTMEKPRSRIVGVERYDQPTEGRQHGNITSRGVVEIEGGSIG
jgi:hypothetical protein